MDNYSFFALVFRQKYIRRWGLMRNTLSENLSEHAMETAVLAHALAVIGNEYFQKSHDPDRIATLALFHDVPEVYTGDLPTPVKYFDRNTRESYKHIEDQAIQTLLSKLPDPLRASYQEIFSGGKAEEHKLIKAADKLTAYIKCVEEEKCGNTEFLSAKNATAKSLSDMHCEELDWFIQHLLPCFGMTIDEMQANNQ
ncbi:MAG: 5'-deoxynucleotidase [Ruminococcaceae bacterium]|nr:5'-deoxynucleotidase [Oscillospiraceae bacterium]